MDATAMEFFFLEQSQPAFQGMNLRQRMAFYHVPAVSLAVSEHGGEPAVQAFGFSDCDTPARPEDLYQAASISKTVFALTAAQLWERGTLSLDEDVNHYLKRFSAADPQGTPQAVTLRQILSHTAGFNVHGFAGYDREALSRSLPEVLEGRGLSERVSVVAEPGTECSYSGGGTSVGQIAVEDVTGKSFSELAEELVLEPFGMSSSGFWQPPTPELAARCATAHDENGLKIRGRFHVYPMLAAAGLWTTAGDLARLGLGMLNSLSGHGPINQKLAEQMITPAPVSGGAFGIGFELNACGFGHRGSNDGYMAMLQCSRNDRLVFAAMTNGDGGGALCRELLAAVQKQGY